MSGGDEAFTDLFVSLLMLLALWAGGHIFMYAGLPSLVGEICVGILMGPHGLEIIGEEYVPSWKLIGEIGLLLLVLEAGLDVDIAMLKVIGLRGAAVAIFGSIIPMGIGFGIATALGSKWKAALAIGATLAPTSMGIALNVLRSGKCLQTRTGQLVIAAAVLDDVLALIILSEIQALEEMHWYNFVLPIVVSFSLMALFGFLAVKVLPQAIKKHMSRFDHHHRQFLLLGLLFTTVLIMIPACYYTKSSYLLGAFLTGLCFCTDHTTHEAWVDQVKRIMHWMLIIFFGCTIGFEIPIRDFWNTRVWGKAGGYFVAIIGKLATGFWVSPFKMSEFWKVAFAMSAWGEFAFIIATYSYEHNIVDQDEYSAVILAVLISVIVSPILLGCTIKYYRKKQDNIRSKVLGGSPRKTAPEKGQELHPDTIEPVYYCVDARAFPSWHQQDKMLLACEDLNLELVDFRTWRATFQLKMRHTKHQKNELPEKEHDHPEHDDHKDLVFYEIYLRDTDLELHPVDYEHLPEDAQKTAAERVNTIHQTLMDVLHEDKPSISVSRWIPDHHHEDVFHHFHQEGQAAQPMSSNHAPGTSNQGDAGDLADTSIPMSQMDHQESEI